METSYLLEEASLETSTTASESYDVEQVAEKSYLLVAADFVVAAGAVVVAEAAAAADVGDKFEISTVPGERKISEVLVPSAVVALAAYLVAHSHHYSLVLLVVAVAAAYTFAAAAAEFDAAVAVATVYA